MADLTRDDGGRWRERHDGWTAPRRTAFLNALAKTGCVRDACRTVGMSNQAGYRLRRRCPAFAAEWDRALKGARATLEGAAYARAVEGWEEPVYQGGRLVGTKRRFSDSLLRLLILRGDMTGADGVPARRTPQGRVLADNEVYNDWTGEVYVEMTQEEAKAEVMRRLDLLAAPDPFGDASAEAAAERDDAGAGGDAAWPGWTDPAEPGAGAAR